MMKRQKIYESVEILFNKNINHPCIIVEPKILCKEAIFTSSPTTFRKENIFLKYNENRNKDTYIFNKLFYETSENLENFKYPSDFTSDDINIVKDKIKNIKTQQKIIH